MLKCERIPITTVSAKKRFERPHSDRNAALFMTSAIAHPTLQRVAYNRLARVGGVKLAG